MSFDIYWYLAFASQIDDVDVKSCTDRQTHTRAQPRSYFSQNLEYWNNLEQFGTIWNNLEQFETRTCACANSSSEATMPKAGPSPLEWKRRLEGFARGEYTFSTGHKPRKGSKWHRDLCAIEVCPRHGKPTNGNARDPYGRPLVCKCGYHINKISTAAKVSRYSML